MCVRAWARVCVCVFGLLAGMLLRVISILGEFKHVVVLNNAGDHGHFLLVPKILILAAAKLSQKIHRINSWLLLL